MVGAVVHPLLPGGWLTVVSFIVAGFFPVWVMARGLSGQIYPSAITRRLVFRPFWYAMAAMPLLAVAAVVGVAAGIPFGASRVVGDWTVGTAGAIIVVGAGLGYIGSRQLAVRHLTVRLPTLPHAFHGARIVQLSDLHLGPHTPRGFLDGIARALQSAEPHLVVLTGDQVDDFPRDTERLDVILGEVKPPLGAFAVPGNHDVYAGWSAVRGGLATQGITVLVNDAAVVEQRGGRIWLAGTGDPAGLGWGGSGRTSAAPDIDRTLHQVPGSEVVIVLAHNPALWPALAERGVDLTLSGHTHYGQLAIPRLNWCLASPFLKLAMGVHRAGDSLLYISPGTNYWGIPFRLGTPPEVTVLTLERSDGATGASIEEGSL